MTEHESSNTSLSHLISTHIEQQYQGAFSTSHDSIPAKKKSWLTSVNEKVQQMLGKEDDIRHFEEKIKKNTPLQEILGGFLAFACILGIFPLLAWSGDFFKICFTHLGWGDLLKTENTSFMSYVATFGWIILTAISAMSVNIIGMLYVLPWIMKGKLFNKKRRKLIAQKEAIVAQMNEHYAELQTVFTADVIQGLEDYFILHFPGITHPKGYEYHECYQLMKNSFQSNPVDYKIAMIRIESLLAMVEELHPEGIADEHKLLINKIRQIL
jgi:hypothetical protein